MDCSKFKNVRTFDFRQLRRLPPGIEKKLEKVNLRFAQNLVAFFRSIAGESKEEILVSSHQTTLEPFIAEKEAGKFDFTFQIEPGQMGRLALDRNMITGLLCFYLGYPDSKKVSPMNLSKIEMSALFQLVKDMVKELQNAWGEDLSLNELSSGYGKGLAAGPVVSKFYVKFGTASGEMETGYPLTVLDRISNEASNSKIEFKQRIKELIEDSDVELTCVLGNAETYYHASLHLTLNQIAELKPGNVILTDKEGDSEITALIQEKNKFRGVPGIYKGRKGVKITHVFS
jgi:flagellar motor switch protein FliM